MKNKIIIGRLENIDLPELKIKCLTAKVDTGAQTSSLHVDNIKKIRIKGKPGVSFDIHPDIHDVKRTISCEALLHDVRNIKSSNGITEQRYVIVTPAILGQLNNEIQITLTDRSDMSYLMLLGCQALSDHFYVDVSETFLASEE